MIGGDVVYAGGLDHVLYALRARTGTLLWSRTTRGAILGSPAVGSQSVFVGSLDGRLYAFDRLHGDTRWVLETQRGITGSPTPGEGSVYVGSMDGFVYAARASNGEVVWRFPTRGEVRSSPAFSHGRVYVGGSMHDVWALDAKTGDSLWFQRTKAPVNGSPVVRNGMVYVGSQDDRLYAIDARTGNVRLRSYVGTNRSSPLMIGSVTDEYVYAASRDGRVYAVETVPEGVAWKQGAVGWSFEAGGSVLRAPVLRRGTLLVANRRGVLYGLDPVSGRSIWSMRPGYVTAPPAVFDRLMIVGDWGGRLRAIREFDRRGSLTGRQGSPVVRPSADAVSRVRRTGEDPHRRDS